MFLKAYIQTGFPQMFKLCYIFSYEFKAILKQNIKDKVAFFQCPLGNDKILFCPYCSTLASMSGLFRCLCMKFDGSFSRRAPRQRSCQLEKVRCKTPAMFVPRARQSVLAGDVLAREKDSLLFAAWCCQIRNESHLHFSEYLQRDEL